ncbi:PQQ-binding-like beta-propeller repeat protein [Planctomycetota bacterium]
MLSAKHTRIIVLLMAIPLMAGAADWPRWRGPDLNGISTETDLNLAWPEEGPKILWRKSVGTGFSSMAVSDGRVYALGNTGKPKVKNEGELKDVVYCFDALTGEEIWHYGYTEDLFPKYYEGGTSASPTVDGDVVYTMSKTGKVFCFHKATGDVVWQRDLMAEHNIQLAEWRLAGSPLVYEDLLILNAGTHGLALKRATGELAWSTGTGATGYATPIPYTQDGQDCVVIFGSQTLAGLVARTGKVLWTEFWETQHNENDADPLIHAGQVFVSTKGNAGCGMFKIAGDHLTEVWRHKDMSIRTAAPILWQGHIYAFDNETLKCLNFKTGDVLWDKEGYGRGTLCMAGDKMILLSETGTLVVADGNPKGFKELASASVIKGRCWTVPVLANGLIYARNAVGDLVCVDLRQ